MHSDSLVARNVCRIIEARGVKKCVVAERAGMTPVQFSSLLHGRKRFETPHIVGLSRALDVTPADLFEGYSDPAPRPTKPRSTTD